MSHSVSSKVESKAGYTKVYLAWVAAALFFFYQYILRVSPGVMINELRSDFRLTAEQFSTLGSIYLAAYSLLQVPLGIIVDRIGVKRTILGSLTLCILGTVLLSRAESFWVAQMSRFLIGAGSASAFMSCLKTVAHSLPKSQSAFLVGSTLTLGTIGAFIAGKPIALLLEVVSWRTIVFYSGLLGILILLVNFLLLPKSKREEVGSQRGSVVKDCKVILQNRAILIYGFLAVALYTPLAALADFWGTAFFMQKFSLARPDAAQTALMMYVGLAIGSLILPWVSQKYDALNTTIRVCCFSLLGLFALLIYGPIFQGIGLNILVIGIGLFCGAEMMCFSGALNQVDETRAGVTIGIVNTFNMLGGGIIQQGVGSLLDLQWDGMMTDDGLRAYTTSQYTYALSILMVILVFCCYSALRLKRQR